MIKIISEENTPIEINKKRKSIQQFEVFKDEESSLGFDASNLSSLGFDLSNLSLSNSTLK